MNPPFIMSKMVGSILSDYGRPGNNLSGVAVQFATQVGANAMQ